MFGGMHGLPDAFYLNMENLAQKTINELGLKSYLELGIGNGRAFNSINCPEKISVDIDKDATYKMSTRSFFLNQFQNPEPHRFQAVYIDACHALQHVIDDFNNCLYFLDKPGIILIHDLFPPSEKHIDPMECGDSFSILAHFLKNGYNFYFNKDDCGLTILNSHQHIFNLERITYAELCALDFGSHDICVEDFILKAKEMAKV
jgi:hypothetical protein